MAVVELLVHVSGKQQDDHYRRMAEAYQEFEVEHIVDEISHEQQAHIAWDEADLARNRSPPATRQPASGLSTPQNRNAEPLLFTNFSPYLATAAVARSVQDDRIVSKESSAKAIEGISHDSIESGASAAAALQSQLWTSSLAAQAYEEVDQSHEEEQSSPLAPSTAPAPEKAHPHSKILIAPSAFDGAQDEAVGIAKRSRISLDGGDAEALDAPEERLSNTAMIEDSLNIRRKRFNDPIPDHEPVPVASSRTITAISDGRASIIGKAVQDIPDQMEGPRSPMQHPSFDITTKQSLSANQSAVTISLSLLPGARPHPNLPSSGRALPASPGDVSSDRVHEAAESGPITSNALLTAVQHPAAVSEIVNQSQFLFIRAASPTPSLAAGPPFTASDETGSHITGPLEHLYKRFAAVQPPRFVPTLQARPLRKQERGYWNVPSASTTSVWDTQLSRDFWAFLEDFISTGQAGWGVSCVRVASQTESGDSMAPTLPNFDTVSAGLCDCRIYCWGEVIEHIWYLLFVASKSKVKNAGLHWLDGAGKIVVQMP